MSGAPAVATEALIEQLTALGNDEERKQFVAANPALPSPQLVSDLTARVTRHLRVNCEEALAIADATIAIAEATGSVAALAESLRAKANALWASGKNAAAVEFHGRAAELFRQVGDRNQLARTLSASIQPLMLLGEYDRAHAAGDEASRIFREQGNLWRLARVQFNVGNIFHRQERFTEALQVWQDAYEELKKHDDAEGIAGALSNLAIVHISLHNFAEAADCYERARAFSIEHEMPLLVVQADYNIAYLHYQRGEYGKAIEMLRAARVSARQLNDRYHGALCDLDLSELYLELNLNADAAELAQAAHQSFAEQGMRYEAAKALAFQAMAISQLGQAFDGVKRFREAREMFVRENNAVWPSLIDLYQALVLYNEGRLFEARQFCNAAHEFFQNSSLPGKAAIAMLLLARIMLRLGDSASARKHCGAALTLISQIEVPILVYQAEFLMGQIRDAERQPDEAYGCYSRARVALETLRGNLRGEELKISFFTNKLEVYENLVASCLSRGASPADMQEAFGYVEQAKSRTLMDLLLQPVRSQAVWDEEDAQSELVRSIRKLREELNWYYNLIEREQLSPHEKSAERIRALEEKARTRESDLLHVLQETNLENADNAGVHLPTHLSIEEIREALPADTALVEYFKLQDRYIACVLTRDQLHMAPVTLASRVDQALRLLQFQMSKFRLDPHYVATYGDSMLQSTRGHLKTLYEELIAPLKGNLDAKHLAIVPHGALHYVPFHALFDGERYLIDEFEISVAPSASVFALCQRRHADSTGGMLLMGVADDRAPLIRDEVESIGALFPDATVLMAESATVEALRKIGAESRMVHIATHGQFRHDNPMFSSLRLADSHLSLYDLYQLKLPAELVVLSGCATGLNAVAAGDELIGMVRGLLHAGASSLVLSLWDVHDGSTAEFMVSFYKNLRAAKGKGAALRAAMLEVRSRHPHPYHWAPFFLVGQA